MTTPNAAAASLLNEFSDALAKVIADKVAAQLLEVIANVQQPQPWRLLSTTEAAAVLCRSRRWMLTAVKERGLPYVRLDGGGLAFDPEDLQSWARSRRIPPVEPRATPCRGIAIPLSMTPGGRESD